MEAPNNVHIYRIHFLFCELCSQREPFCKEMGVGDYKDDAWIKPRVWNTLLLVFACLLLRLQHCSPVLDYMRECCFVIT